MKHEWRKAEKDYYLPKNKPELVRIPRFKFFTISGEGNPNSDHFSGYIEVLYSLSYAVRMSPKKGMAPTNYFEYTVYPLEGVWDVQDTVKQNPDYQLDKDDLVFTLMIRQPDFVDEAFAKKMIEYTQEKKPHPLLGQVRFESISEGECIQMLHLGSYDEEPASFQQMEEFASSIGRKRQSKVHREIYLTDARKTTPEKLKTVLRFTLE
jgi:hypothetical protein